jgi:hypothetical protein
VDPLLALIFTVPDASIGNVASGAATDAVTGLLRANGVLPPDVTMLPSPSRVAGTSRYMYLRSIDGLLVYVNKALSAMVDPSGRVTAIGRRRPLLAASMYPLRTPESAWRLATEGRWTTMFLDDGGTVDPTQIEEFVVQRVELAYAEVEVRAPRELMQPYYLFRDAAGHALYVPALADPYAQLPSARP